MAHPLLNQVAALAGHVGNNRVIICERVFNNVYRLVPVFNGYFICFSVSTYNLKHEHVCLYTAKWQTEAMFLTEMKDRKLVQDWFCSFKPTRRQVAYFTLYGYENMLWIHWYVLVHIEIYREYSGNSVLHHRVGYQILFKI